MNDRLAAVLRLKEVQRKNLSDALKVAEAEVRRLERLLEEHDETVAGLVNEDR